MTRVVHSPEFIHRQGSSGHFSSVRLPRFGAMFDSLVAATAGARGAGAVGGWARVESAACARRLAAMVALLDEAYAADGSGERDLWCVDNFDAVAAHIAATQCLTTGAAGNLLFLAAALHEQFPKVAGVFADGLISFSLVRTIVGRTRLAIVPDARRQIDDALAEACRNWEPMSKVKTEQFIDAIIEQFDPDAVRRTQTSARGRSVDFDFEDGTGMARMYATLFVPDATALDARLDALADTVCPADSRTKEQRRADALGALSVGADRLPCLCGVDTCPAAGEPPPSATVIYVIAHQDTIQAPAPAAESEPATADRVEDGGPVPDPEAEPTSALEPESASHPHAAEPETSTETVLPVPSISTPACTAILSPAPAADGGSAPSPPRRPRGASP